MPPARAPADLPEGDGAGEEPRPGGTVGIPPVGPAVWSRPRTISIAEVVESSETDPTERPEPEYARRPARRRGAAARRSGGFFFSRASPAPEGRRPRGIGGCPREFCRPIGQAAGRRNRDRAVPAV